MAVLKVLLLILKILGITLLVILGLVLLLLLLVLFAPVRYKGSFIRREDPQEMKLNTVVSWINPLIRFRLWMEEKKIHYTVRVFGLCVKNSDKPKKEKKKKEKKKKEKKSKKESAALSDKTEEQTEPIASEEKTQQDNKAEDMAGEVKTISEETEETASFGEAAEEPEEEKKEGFFKKLSAKINGIIEKIKGVIDKIKAIPEKIKQKLQRIKDNILLLVKKKDALFRFVSKEANKKVFGSAFKAVGKILRHILPVKLKGSLVFGTGDPESTGKALGIAAVFYPVYEKSFTIQPDFAEKRIEADISFRGRIRVATLLWIFARFWWSRETKRFRKEYKRLEKVLKSKAE